MAPSRGVNKMPAAGRQGSPIIPDRPSRSALQAKQADVYRDMLIEAAVNDASELSNRPLKRRRMATVPSRSLQGGQEPASSDATTGVRHVETSMFIGHLQTAETSSDDSDESEYGFEDVDLDGPAVSETAASTNGTIADVSISVAQPTTLKRKTPVQRKGVSAAEKAHRLMVHKAHLVCLLGHCIYVNSLCNLIDLQESLEPILPAKTKMYLRANTRESQFDRNRMFTEGLEQAVQTFRLRFDVTKSGMRRAKWLQDDDAPIHEADPVDRDHLLAASKTLQGSQDTGNQLFCALLRGVGVDVRLVCSLQPLPFSTAAPKTTPVKHTKPAVYAYPHDPGMDNSEVSADDASVRSSTMIGRVPPVRRRLGQPAFLGSPSTSTTPQTVKRPVRRLQYPVFWVEAFNAAMQKWIPVDPVVTGTMAKPSKLEPPASYEPNQLSYVVAFESDGAGKDVTRRYAKAFNAKTRRQRVESTADGTQWWNKIMRFFRRRGPKVDREQVEDAELQQKEAKEGLPANVQDFKDHPVYALERHLRRHEVIHPRREVGKTNAGTAAKPRMEAVFRRQDVLICRSADKWFRMGREVKTGEQPLKHIASRRSRTAHQKDGDDEGDAESNATALYAFHQTELYIPPPVVRGRVPRNAFGNLDIYVPSMVPAGGVHIRHPLTAQAAKILRVDYADAVTGFQFKGRQGAAVIQGAVVPTRFAGAVMAVIEGLEYEREWEESKARSLVALTLWARWMRALQIKERVSGYADSAADAKSKGIEHEEEASTRREVAALDAAHVEEGPPLLTAGMYSTDDITKPKRAPRKPSRAAAESDDDSLEEDDDIANETSNLRRSKRRTMRARPRILDDEDWDDDNDDSAGQSRHETNEIDDGGGGFINEGHQEDDTEEYGGGFVAEDDDEGGGFIEDDEDDDGGGDGGGGAKVSIEITQYRPSYGGSLEALDETEGKDMPTAPEHGSKPLGQGDEESSLTSRYNHPQEQKQSQDIEMADAVSPVGITNTNAQSDVLSASGNIPSNADIQDPAKLSKHEAAKSPPSTQPNETDAVSGPDDEEDMGSLLSHDPEDEDAEPDWLESD